MANTAHIVKRKGHSEPFDARKLYASVYSACLALRIPQGEAELVAEEVVSNVTSWISPKKEVTSHDISLQAHKHLNPLNSDAAYLYKHHNSIN